MGVQSIDDVIKMVRDKKFQELLKNCREEHLKLQKQVEKELARFHDEGKDPNPILKGMSFMKTTVKISLKDSDTTIASLMTDGCNMGVKSLNRYLNEYEAAEERTKDITKRLIKLEEKLVEDIRDYL